MDVDDQCQLIREFMLVLAPAVIVHSLSNDGSIADGAELTLEASLQLAARYNQLRETLTAPPQNALAPGKSKTPEATQGVHKTQARVPIAKPEVQDLPSSGSGRPSPMDPSWRPPKPC